MRKAGWTTTGPTTGRRMRTDGAARGRRPRVRWSAAAGLAVVVLGAAPGAAVVGSRDGVPFARGCLSGPQTPGAFVDSSGPDGYALAAGARPCEYVALEPGGFDVPAGAFSLRVERGGRVTVFDRSDGGCGDGVIREGDRVTFTAQVWGRAGADSGCAAP